MRRGRQQPIQPNLHEAQVRDLADRFWQRTERRGADECWHWTGGHGSAGYGHIWAGNRSLKAHRVAWFLAHCEWPDLLVCHHCDNTRCVNPAHLFLGTCKDNTGDMVSKGRGGAPPHPHGEGVGTSKLSRNQINEIRRRCASGETQTVVRRDFGIASSHISRIVNRQGWAWL
jgi:hypothetical protein